MSKISFISQALLYVHVCFIYVAHKIVHELHAAVLEKKHVAGHIDMKLKQTSLRFAC